MDVEALIAFLAELKANNHKTWFDQNRARYEGLRADFHADLQVIIDGFADYDPPLAALKPKDCSFRINKRFPDKDGPYKPHFSAHFTGVGRGPSNVGYYFEIPADGLVWVGGGWYQPAPPHLKWIHTDIAAHPEKITRLIDAADLKAMFGGLSDLRAKKVPKDFPADHPQAELLKQKGFVVMEEKDAHAMSGTLTEHVASRFKVIAPLVKYLRTLEEAAPELDSKPR